MKQAIPLLAGLLIAAAAPASAAVYYGSTFVQTTFDTDDNMPDVDLLVRTSATVNTSVTIENGKIQFAANNVSLPAKTYTGSQTVLNPNTLQNTTITFSFTTTAVDFAFPATNPATLVSQGSSLSWTANEFSSTVTFPLTGTYTVSGPTQTFTGSFNNTMQARGRVDGGTISVNGDGSLNMTGDNYIDFSGATNPIFNLVVDGVPVNFSVTGFPVLIEEYASGTFTPAPEASTLGISLLGAGAFLLRRRR